MSEFGWEKEGERDWKGALDEEFMWGRHPQSNSQSENILFSLANFVSLSLAYSQRGRKPFHRTPGLDFNGVKVYFDIYA